MQSNTLFPRIAAGLLLALSCNGVRAALPAPTPQQQQAEATKKAQAAEQAEQEKQRLAASMEQLAARWRASAAHNGWQTHPPTPVDPVAGIAASGAQQGAAGQPGGQAGSAAASAPVRSEKLGTAAASTDVKDPSKKGK